MNRIGTKEYQRAHRWIFHLCSIYMASAFVQQAPLTTPLQQHRRTSHSLGSLGETRRLNSAIWSTVKTDGLADNKDKTFDELLGDPSNFAKAIRFFRSHPEDIELTRDRFGKIFDAIEERTFQDDTDNSGQRQQQQQPAFSQSRKEMAEMYSLLKEQGHLRLFGAITKENMPASGSHNVRPKMLEAITSLSMSSLTPQPSNTLLYAGMGVALLESIASGFLGLDLNAVFFATFGVALCDQVFLNGAVSETCVKMLSPETQPKITRHEAGHFLCSYILGCPVEGYVLSSWGALEDPRFRGLGVSAGTSFFDPDLSSQIENSKITRSAIDRYSIIVMAGIAAEAVMYGKADGGAGDEQALIAFLSNLNGGPSLSSAPVWNEQTIRNQARWGALQSVLILREYKECYDALVDTLERNGSLGDCIYAIENAAREHDLQPLRIPLGYISEEGDTEIWNKIVPSQPSDENTVQEAAAKTQVSAPEVKKTTADPEESLASLRAYKETITNKLRDIDEKLEGL
ncbi:unnamed protein product [Pseudo-nitzschia multistriata]|uniref:Peptidase M41 domain-containing protein n=1 Tax=Pseudo-nitzschia multistriata TaxID=183589 RepID=A0A448ZEE6_9STRA|nr:unnamed protein product [Pseudo-nitzschia multistriata]